MLQGINSFKKSHIMQLYLRLTNFLNNLCAHYGKHYKGTLIYLQNTVQGGIEMHFFEA